MYVVYFFTYMLSVEFFVYWAHRLLHEIKPGYKWLHYIHHKYNKEHTLSPFAGLAFHPIDGMLQVRALLRPMHDKLGIASGHCVRGLSASRTGGRLTVCAPGPDSPCA